MCWVRRGNWGEQRRAGPHRKRRSRSLLRARRPLPRAARAASTSTASRRWCGCRCCSAERDHRRRARHAPASSPATAARPSAPTTWRCGRRRRTSRSHRIHFKPGVNEDLAATAVWGIAAVRLLRRRALRRRVRHLVRQGAGRRPLLRRAQARQLRRHRAERRRARALRRRSRRALVVDRAPERARADPLRDPDPESRQACRTTSTSASTGSRSRASRAAGSGSSASPTRSRRAASVESAPSARRGRDCPRTSTRPPPGCTSRCVEPAARASSGALFDTACRRRRPSRAPTGSTASCSARRPAPPRHRHRAARPISTCARRSTTLGVDDATRRGARPRASTRWRWRGRSSPRGARVRRAARTTAGRGGEAPAPRGAARARSSTTRRIAPRLHGQARRRRRSRSCPTSASSRRQGVASVVCAVARSTPRATS